VSHPEGFIYDFEWANEEFQVLERPFGLNGVTVLDGEGDEAFSLPETVSVNILKAILSIRDRANKQGEEFGQWKKAQEIRRALNVEEKPS
jgi:hypothetical protein